MCYKTMFYSYYMELHNDNTSTSRQADKILQAGSDLQSMQTHYFDV